MTSRRTQRRTRRDSRGIRLGALVAIAIAGSGCSGPESPGAAEPEPGPPPTAAADADPQQPAGTSVADDDDRGGDGAAPVTAASVRIDVSVAGTTVELSGTFAESADPFGDFVSCSVLRANFGSYSVLASATTGTIRSIGVVSSDLVLGAGTHDATVRVEYDARGAVDALGTITIADDLRSGSYLGFDSSGAQVEGTFDCQGGVVGEPLPAGVIDDELESVEVFALVRLDDAQRLVGLAVESGDLASVECAGASGESDESTIVRVDGDGSVGAITTFELTGGSSPTMRMRIGSTSYEFARVVRGEADASAAGTFSATADGATVDGAFRCS